MHVCLCMLRRTQQLCFKGMLGGHVSGHVSKHVLLWSGVSLCLRFEIPDIWTSQIHQSLSTLENESNILYCSTSPSPGRLTRDSLIDDAFISFSPTYVEAIPQLRNGICASLHLPPKIATWWGCHSENNPSMGAWRSPGRDATIRLHVPRNSSATSEVHHGVPFFRRLSRLSSDNLEEAASSGCPEDLVEDLMKSPLICPRLGCCISAFLPNFRLLLQY